MKKLRYFIDFIDRQQEWLNTMAAKGYRLSKTTRMGYEFTPCEPNRYHYVVQCVMEKSRTEVKEYRKYLEEMGYNHYPKNINIQFGYKAKLRYNGERLQLASNPGLLNHELLIIEVPKGEELEIFTTAKECYAYYKRLTNIFAVASVLIVLIACFGRTKFEWFGHTYLNEQFVILQFLLFLCALPTLFITFRMGKRAMKWKREMQVME